MRPRFALAPALAVSLLALVPKIALAQHAKVTDLHAATARGATSANIKNDNPTNQAGAKAAPLPARKGGAKARGATPPTYCTLHVDNRSDWIVSVYLNGVRVGTMGRYGDAYQDYPCGYYTFYAQAIFDDGSVRTWGPARLDLTDDATERIWP